MENVQNVAFVAKIAIAFDGLCCDLRDKRPRIAQKAAKAANATPFFVPIVRMWMLRCESHP